MADIEQTSGELNMTATVYGEAVTFYSLHSGDITADLIEAVITDSTGLEVSLTVTMNYDSTATQTTVRYDLSAVDAATLALGVANWKMTQTHSGIPRRILAGIWGVYA